MKKLYVLEAARGDGDSYDIKVTFNKEEAIKAYEDDFFHLTAAEKLTYEYILWTYRYEGSEELAQDAWREMSDVCWIDDEYVIETEVMKA